MKYLLDFDRTLFDTDAYNLSLAEHPACAAFADEIRRVLTTPWDHSQGRNPERALLWEKVSAVMQTGALTFAEGELAHFLFPDARSFLEAYGSELAIITYGEATRQRLKIESALGSLPPIAVWYTGLLDKAEYLASTSEYAGTPAVFVDDLPLELSQMSEQYPAISGYEIRRDGRAGDGRWPVIRSLAELV